MKVEKNAPTFPTESYPRQPESRGRTSTVPVSGAARQMREPSGSQIVFAIDAYVHEEGGRMEVVLHNIKDSVALLQEAKQAMKLVRGILEKLQHMLKAGDKDTFAWEQLVKKLMRVAGETNFKGIHLLNESARNTTLQLMTVSGVVDVPLLDVTSPSFGVEAVLQEQTAERLEKAIGLVNSHAQQLLEAEQIMRSYFEGRTWTAALLQTMYEKEAGFGKFIHETPMLRAAAEWAAAMLLQPEMRKNTSITLTIAAGLLVLLLLYIAAASY